MIPFSTINKNWTLFLDRDGVINYEKKADYIRNKDEFTFYPGVLKAIEIFSKIFNRIIVVTNQKGIGKKLMTVEDLNEIHAFMIEKIELENGKIDKIYFCSDLDDASSNRKPNAGMAFQAQQDFSDIQFSTSIMVGNKLSDMQFGKAAGMYTVFVATTNPEIEFPHPLINNRFNSLIEFAQHLKTV